MLTCGNEINNLKNTLGTDVIQAQKSLGYLLTPPLSSSVSAAPTLTYVADVPQC